MFLSMSKTLHISTIKGPGLNLNKKNFVPIFMVHSLVMRKHDLFIIWEEKKLLQRKKA
jgi:hypothetical protein